MSAVMKCPFCSSKNTAVKVRGGFVACNDCGSTGPICNDTQHAIDTWNAATRRADELEAEREAQADYITWIDHRYYLAQNEILERERQLSIAAAYIGAGKDANVIVLRNEAGEFVDIVKPETSASMSDGIEPVKLAKL